MKTINLGYVHMSNYVTGHALDYPVMGRKNLDPHQVVLPVGSYSLHIDYPLGEETPFRKTFTVPVGGMTRRTLVNRIVKAYKYVYKNQRKYGIWGHRLSDLFLHTAYVHRGFVVGVDCDS